MGIINYLFGSWVDIEECQATAVVDSVFGSHEKHGLIVTTENSKTGEIRHYFEDAQGSRTRISSGLVRSLKRGTSGAKP